MAVETNVLQIEILSQTSHLYERRTTRFQIIYNSEKPLAQKCKLGHKSKRKPFTKEDIFSYE